MGKRVYWKGKANISLTTVSPSNKQLIWKKGSKCGWNLQISLVTVSHMASCNLAKYSFEKASPSVGKMELFP